jgi:hypothetical protein
MLRTLLLLGWLQGQAPEPPELELAPPAAAPSTPTASQRFISAGLNVIASSITACIAAGVGVTGGLLCLAAGSGTITALLVTREARAPVGGNVKSALIDSMLFSILLAMGMAPLIAVGAFVLDTLGYVAVQPWRHRVVDLHSLWPVLAALVGSVPGGCLMTAGGALFLTWLGFQGLTDALMPLAVGMAGVGAVLLLLGVLVARPLLHLAMELGWDFFHPH